MGRFRDDGGLGLALDALGDHARLIAPTISKMAMGSDLVSERDAS